MATAQEVRQQIRQQRATIAATRQAIQQTPGPTRAELTGAGLEQLRQRQLQEQSKQQALQKLQKQEAEFEAQAQQVEQKIAEQEAVISSQERIKKAIELSIRRGGVGTIVGSAIKDLTPEEQEQVRNIITEQGKVVEKYEQKARAYKEKIEPILVELQKEGFKIESPGGYETTNPFNVSTITPPGGEPIPIREWAEKQIGIPVPEGKYETITLTPTPLVITEAEAQKAKLSDIERKRFTILPDKTYTPIDYAKEIDKPLTTYQYQPFTAYEAFERNIASAIGLTPERREKIARALTYPASELEEKGYKIYAPAFSFGFPVIPPTGRGQKEFLFGATGRPIQTTLLFGLGYAGGKVSTSLGGTGIGKWLGTSKIAKVSTKILPATYLGMKGYQYVKTPQELRAQFLGETAAEVTAFGLGYKFSKVDRALLNKLFKQQEKLYQDIRGKSGSSKQKVVKTSAKKTRAYVRNFENMFAEEGGAEKIKSLLKEYSRQIQVETNPIKKEAGIYNLKVLLKELQARGLIKGEFVFNEQTGQIAFISPKTLIKVDIKTTPSVTTTPQQYFGYKGTPISPSFFDIKEKPKEKEIQKQIISEISKTKQQEKQITITATSVIGAIKSAQIEAGKQIVAQIPTQTLLEKQITIQKTKQATRETLKPAKPIYPTTTIITPTPTLEGGVSKKRKLLTGILKSKAFEVLVRRKGKYTKISKEPLPYGKALKLGATKVRKTLAATFKLKPAGETTLADIGFKLSPLEFRKPKTKEPLTFIEIKERRLKRGTGEIPEILKIRKSKRKMKWL